MSPLFTQKSYIQNTIPTTRKIGASPYLSSKLPEVSWNKSKKELMGFDAFHIEKGPIKLNSSHIKKNSQFKDEGTFCKLI